MVNLRAHDPFSGHAPADAPGEQSPAPANSPPVVDTPTDGLDGMLKTELADLAAAMGLPTSGTKADLIDRVRADRAHSPR